MKKVLIFISKKTKKSCLKIDKIYAKREKIEDKIL